MSQQYNNDFLDAYMRMVEDTESPRVFHVWSALTGISACMGRRLFMPFGVTGHIFGNLLVLLVGPPASRKSTAINIMSRLLRETTRVKFAPDNTGGKFQGLLTAIKAGEDDDESKDMKEFRELMEAGIPTLDALNKTTILANGHDIHEADKHSIFVSASEFISFIGIGNLDFLTFLGKIWDGEPFDYQLRKEKITLSDSLLSLIGGTTPTNIAEAFPPAAIGQGITSRIIFVYGGKKYKSIPRPGVPDVQTVEFVKKRFSDIYYSLEGEMKESPNAKAFADSIYEAASDLTDGRFTHYTQRRHAHFMKVGMVFAAARLSNVVEELDYMNADTLLTATEKTMPDALGEYGMSRESAGSQQVLDFIRSSKDPITQETLWAFMRRDLRIHELQNVLNDLLRSKKIQRVPLLNGAETGYIPLIAYSPDMLDMMELLQTAPTTERSQ